MTSHNAQDCAARLLSLAPKLMQTLRVEMRAGRPPELTVPQFRSLVFYQMHPGGALSEAAEHLGLSVPSASKVVETLVGRGLLGREVHEQDRRRMVIAITDAGARVLAAARKEAAQVFAKRLKKLSDMELSVLFAVLGTLQEVFDVEPPASDSTEG